MKIILEEEDFDYMNKIRDSEKIIMQKGEKYILECVVEEPEKAQNFLFSLIDSKVVKNKFTKITGIICPRLSLDLVQDRSNDDIRLILSRIETTLDVIQVIIDDINTNKK